MKTTQNILGDKQRPKLVLYARVVHLGQQEEGRRHKAFLRCTVIMEILKLSTRVSQW